MDAGEAAGLQNFTRQPVLHQLNRVCVNGERLAELFGCRQADAPLTVPTRENKSHGSFSVPYPLS